MTGLLVAWLAAALGLWVASKTLDGVRLASFGDAVWAGALLAVLQWALSWGISVMIGIVTLGIGFLFWFITRWVASALVIMLVSKLSSRLEVRGFLPALITTFIVSAAGAAVRWLM